MRHFFTRGRVVAVVASTIAFVGTFAVSAHAVLDDEIEKKTYIIVYVEADEAEYRVGQEVKLPASTPNTAVEVADGVWAEPAESANG